MCNYLTVLYYSVEQERGERVGVGVGVQQQRGCMHGEIEGGISRLLRESKSFQVGSMQSEGDMVCVSSM